MKKAAPCMDCGARYIGCHAVCVHYLAYAYERERIRERVLEMRRVTEARCASAESTRRRYRVGVYNK